MRIPVISTIIVVAAVAIMVRLGFWQLDRADEKAQLITQYEANQELPVIGSYQPFQTNDDGSFTGPQDELFRTVQIDCDNPQDWKAVAGRHANGQSGYVHMFICHGFPMGALGSSETAGPDLYGTIGWSRSPQQPEWQGGMVTGVLSMAGEDFEVVATQPLAGLAPLAKPDPNDLPNNHLSYAVQWFLFALTALVIYILALRRAAR